MDDKYGDDTVRYIEFDNDDNYEMDCIERARDLNLWGQNVKSR